MTPKAPASSCGYRRRLDWHGGCAGFHGRMAVLCQYSCFVPVAAILCACARIKCQTACKPGSVRALRREATIPLGRALLRASRDQPGRRGGNAPASRSGLPRAAAGHPYSVLLPVGFTLPPLSPGARCALAAPFHPCPQAGRSRRAGGLFSVALSLGSPPPAVSRHRIPVEPGLSSTVVSHGSGRPAVWQRRRCAGCGGMSTARGILRRRRAGLVSRRRELTASVRPRSGVPARSAQECP